MAAKKRPAGPNAGPKQTRPADRSRARKPAQRWPKPDRIREIRRRMLEGRWVRGESEDEAAIEFGVSARHIQIDAGEAQRRLAETVEDEEAIRAQVMGALAKLQQDNYDLRQVALKRGQVRTAIEANRLRLETLKLLIAATGVEPPKKLDIGGNLGELLGLAQQDPEPEGGGSSPTE